MTEKEAVVVGVSESYVNSTSSQWMVSSNSSAFTLVTLPSMLNWQTNLSIGWYIVYASCEVTNDHVLQPALDYELGNMVHFHTNRLPMSRGHKNLISIQNLSSIRQPRTEGGSRTNTRPDAVDASDQNVVPVNKKEAQKSNKQKECRSCSSLPCRGCSGACPRTSRTGIQRRRRWCTSWRWSRWTLRKLWKKFKPVCAAVKESEVGNSKVRTLLPSTDWQLTCEVGLSLWCRWKQVGPEMWMLYVFLWERTFYNMCYSFGF